MRFEVPQFIEIEDKIFGPFTWRQFLYLAGGVGFGGVTFMVLPIFFFVLLGMPVALLAFALAFYPVNNRPFSVFLESIFNFYSTNRIYKWRRGTGAIYTNKENPAATTTPSGTVSSDNITSLARQLELKALQKPQ